MTSAQMFTELIEIALQDDPTIFQFLSSIYEWRVIDTIDRELFVDLKVNSEVIHKYLDNNYPLRHIRLNLSEVIFNHSFAKAIYPAKIYDDFGILSEEAIFSDEFEHEGGSWQYFLQQQVLSPDPLVYMYQHRKGNHESAHSEPNRN